MESHAMEKRNQERRGTSTKEIIPRRFNRREKAFVYERKIYLSDTNAFQNVYFAQFFHFLGEAREDLLAYLLGDQLGALMTSGITLLTRDCSFKYRNSLFAYDQIQVQVSLTKLTQMSVGLSFKIENLTRQQLAGEGSMTIACALGGKLCKLPSALYESADQLFNKGKAPSKVA